MKPTTVTGGWLSVHDPGTRTPAHEVKRLSSALRRFPELAEDQTAATRALEADVAAAIGQPAAVLMPSGKMAQQIALRVHADRRPGRRATLAHPLNHLALWEDSNYAVLHGLDVRPIGDRYRLLEADDLAPTVAGEDVASVLWELPQRELGGELPRWQDLCDQVRLAREAGLAAHLDGARVWQTGPHFGRPVADVGTLFDSVYVSLYKDLGAPRGAVLSGSEEFVAEARRWRHRMGGTQDELWPLALLALEGLHRVLPHMPQFVAHAQVIAHEISSTTPATVRPDPPQAAMFHVHLPVPADAAQRAHDDIVREGGLGLTLRMRTSPDPRRCYFESTIGEQALGVEPRQVAATVRQLVARAS